MLLCSGERAKHMAPFLKALQ